MTSAEPEQLGTSADSEADRATSGIAIIGMAGRFPGARDIGLLWNNLRQGVESISRLPDAELEAAGVDEALRCHPDYVPARGLVEGVDLFDAAFFHYSPREAELIDPQQRLFLECAWEALEHAGYDSERFPGPIGVFAGAGAMGYLLHHVSPHLDSRELIEGIGAVLGNDKDHLTTRVAYKLDLRGPAMTVQTACSTSLVAVQLACQSLLDFQCDMALAGGVSIVFPVGTGYLSQEGHILSPDGHCRAFDARAQGTVPGDGVGIVVLKRLEDSLAAGDTIHAVILGAAVNNDGGNKVGYTAPSITGQAEVIALAQALASVDARTISYVETHGTGTALGDAIEIAALTQAFRRTTQEQGFCALGSVKSNFGHLNTAAGVASLIKTTLALKHRVIPPSLHFERPHPKLGLEDSPFFVNATARPWLDGATPRRAGVSSFAMGGTNAHVVLEEAPLRQPGSPAAAWQLLALSARTSLALDTKAEQLADHLEHHSDIELSDVAYTLQMGRRAFAHRRIVVCKDRADAVQALRTPQRACSSVAADSGRNVVFLLPGQGTQYVGMGQELHHTEEVFREELDRCAKLLYSHLGFDLRNVLYPTEHREDAAARLEQTALAQPALFAIEYALARLWMSRGVHPVAMLGHSLGEYVAACLAGVFSLEDALALVAVRGRLMQGLLSGAMLAVPLAEAELRRLLSAELSLAAINGPEACVVAGPHRAVDALEARLAQRGVRSRRLRTSHAFHSAMMEPIVDAFAEEVQRARPKPPRIPFISNVTGTWVTEIEATDPAYWARHLRQPVRFAAGVAELCREGHVILEVGPGRVLGALAMQQGASAPVIAASLPSATDEQSALSTWLEALGQLWAEGVPVDWNAHYRGQRRHRIPLPTYPFERQRYWLGAAPAPRHGTTGHPEQSLETIEEEIRRSLGIRSLDSYPGLREGLEALCSSHLCQYLQSNGIEIHEGAVHSRLEIRRRLRIQDRFSRLFDAFLAILAEDGIIQLVGDEVRFLRSGQGLEPPHVLRQRVEASHPQFQGMLDFVDHCLSSYSQALNGSIEAISVLFPDGSSRFVQDCEARTVEHRHERIYHLLLKEALCRLAASSRNKRLRILEVGGGQGLMTWPLVSALRDFDIEYWFTDLGRVFVEDAREEAARRDLDGIMQFGVLDISRDTTEQGHSEGTFDVVLAFNVVHATSDVRQTLRQLERLLVPGGTLALVEAVGLSRWELLSWGLAEGWWYYDDDLREGSPLLPLVTWERVLTELGFQGVEAFPRREEARAQVDHGLVLARRAAARSKVTPAAIAHPAPAHRSAHQTRPSLGTEYVAPRSELERCIAAVCEDLLGVAPVGVRDDFVALGADSLIMLRLTDRLRRELGREVPPHAAFRGMNVERLAQALEPAPAPQAPEPQASSIVVALQPSGSKPPLFFVHPAAGVVFPYIELARLLGPDQPFYGLQALGLDGVNAPDERVEDMARHYVEAMRRVQPQGPYFIGGYSFGCLVAFEMALQLTIAGLEVALVALVDEPAPLPGHRPTPLMVARLLATGAARSILPFAQDYLYLLSASRRREAPPGWSHLQNPLRAMETFLARLAMANFIPPDSQALALSQPAMLPMFKLFLTHVRETFAYEPRAYAHRVTLFSTEEVRKSRGLRDRTMGWSKLAAGGVEVHEVPGNHLSLLREPHVQSLATSLADCIARALNRVGPSVPQHTPPTAGQRQIREVGATSLLPVEDVEGAGIVLHRKGQAGQVIEHARGGRPAVCAVGVQDRPQQPAPELVIGGLLCRNTDGVDCALGMRGRLRGDEIEITGAGDERAVINGRVVHFADVEEALRQHGDVLDCAVTARTGPRGAELVAYVVPAASTSALPLRKHVQALLPPSHWPQAYALLTALPLGADGRVDTEALARIPVVDAATIDALAAQIRQWEGVQGVEMREQRWRDAPAPVPAGLLLPAPSRHPSPDTAPTVAPGEPSAHMALVSGAALDLPSAPRTLAEVLERAARGGEPRGVRYWTPEGEQRFESYAALVERGRRVTGGLQRSGLAPGARVLLQFEDGWEFFGAFWGCVLAGLVPVPLSPVWSQPGNAARLADVWRFLDAPPVVTSRAGEPAVRDVAREHGLALAPLIVEDLLAAEPGTPCADTASDDLALLLLTSGSTGVPKAVTQTHRALICRSHAYALHDHASAEDVVFNWMPLDHVGGLVMMSLQAVYLGTTLVQAPMRAILAEPLRWLDGLEQARATVSWAPNFAFGLINDHADEIRGRRWDLGAVRRLQNGGEAVVAKSVRRFLELLEPHGLRPDAVGPAWGMSETCSGVTYERSFTRAASRDEQPHVSVGDPVPGASLRIVDERGELLREGQTGQLEVRGVMVTRGYLRNDEQNRESFTADGWFRTGDLAVLQDGKLTITGRAKDVIIINSVNYAAHEIESVVEDLPGVLPSFTAACSVRLPGSDTDDLAVFFVPRDHDDVDEIVPAIRERVRSRIGISPRRVIALTREEVPKTEIGKIQRSALRLRFADEQRGQDGGAAHARQAGPPGSVPSWFFRRTWRPRVRSAPTRRASEGGMVVFCDESGLGDALLRRLAGARGRGVRVTAARAFRVVSDDHVEIDPTCLEHYGRVFEHVGSELELVLHLWSYGPVRELDWSGVQAGLEHGALSLYLAARALVAHGDETQRRLYAVASHAAEVAPGDLVCAERLASLGLLQTISSELPWLTTSLVDLEGEDRERDAECLLRELGLAISEPEVAYRNRQRHLVYLEPVDLRRQPADPAPLQGRRVEGEICLVTGGLGGLGVQVAERLWRQYGLKPLLLGRTELPPRLEWERYLEDPMSQEVATRIRHHAKLERAGVPFLYRAVDVRDLDALERCIAEAEERLSGRLGCIFHLAGVGNLRKHWQVADQHRIAMESRETFDWMFGPKVQGGWNVARIADERRLPLVLFSSINAFFGGATFSAYSAANSFVEGLAVERRWRHPDLATYCLTWSIWDGLGMSEGNPERLQEISRALGHRIIEVRPGLDSLCGLLHRAPQSILVGLDPDIRRRLVVRAERLIVEPVAEVTAAPGTRLDPVAAAPDRFGQLVQCRVILAGRAGGRNEAASLQAPRTSMEQLVKRAWEAVLGRTVDSVNQNFFDAGGTSLQTAQLQANLRKMVGVEIPVVDLFRHATIAALARHIAALRRGADERPMPAPEKTSARTERPSDVAHLRSSRLDHRGKPSGKPRG